MTDTMQRDVVIASGGKDLEVGEQWIRVIREYEQTHPGFAVADTTFCEFGLAEEAIALLAFVAGAGKTQQWRFVVGIGEILRPYQVRYDGDDPTVASALWLEAVTEHRRTYNGG